MLPLSIDAWHVNVVLSTKHVLSFFLVWDLAPVAMLQVQRHLTKVEVSMLNVFQKPSARQTCNLLERLESCNKVQLVLGFKELFESVQLIPFLAWLQLVGSCPGFPHGVIDPIEVMRFRPSLRTEVLDFAKFIPIMCICH